jgi:hypothetical protein
MIIVPELETVVILPPRTGSGSLKEALLATYPKAVMLYRHMEADGVPIGYDRWRKVGVVRNPIDRLHSMYRFIKFSGGGSYADYPELWKRLQKSVAGEFEDWLLNNEMVFTQGHDSAGRGRYWPQFSTIHSLPENRKSQFIYLRPDLGTELLKFGDWGAIEGRLGVQLGHKNGTGSYERPHLSPEAMRHIVAFHRWDVEASR